MPKGIYKVPVAKNEPVMNYLPGSPERNELKKEIVALNTSLSEDEKWRIFTLKGINDTDFVKLNSNSNFSN